MQYGIANILIKTNFTKSLRVTKEPSLCYTEGITDGIANVRAKAILIQTNGNSISISGANEGSPVNVYDTSGKMVGSGTTLIDITNIPTSLKPGDIGLVKIGEKTIKILMK